MTFDKNLDNKEKIIGVIYALSSERIKNVFDKKKDVFVKYTPHTHTKKSKIKLKVGMKFYFYESRKYKEIVGESIIESFEYLTVNEILKKYDSRLIINEKQLLEYAGNKRIEKPALIIIFQKIRKYNKPKKLNFSITMGGLYVTEQNKEKILGVN